MQVRDVMNPKSARISAHATLQTAVELLVASGESDLAVVDEEGRFLGVLAEGDLLRAVLPDIDEVLAHGGSLDDALRLFLGSGERLANEPITRLVIENPVRVAPADDLLKIATIMVRKMIRRLHVLDGERFVGSISRADLLWGLLSKDRGRA